MCVEDQIFRLKSFIIEITILRFHQVMKNISLKFNVREARMDSHLH